MTRGVEMIVRKGGMELPSRGEFSGGTQKGGPEKRKKKGCRAIP